MEKFSEAEWNEWKTSLAECLSSNRVIVSGHRYTRPAPSTYEHQWLWDSCFHAISYRWIDPSMARDELISVASHQFESGSDAGMIPHMIYWGSGGEELWQFADRSTISQPPLIAFAALYPPLATSAKVRDRWHADQPPGLDGWEIKGITMQLGACLPLQSMMAVPGLPAALVDAIQQETNYNLRQVATLAGSLVASDGRSSLAAALLSLDAGVQILRHHQKPIQLSLEGEPMGLVSHFDPPDIAPGQTSSLVISDTATPATMTITSTTTGTTGTGPTVAVIASMNPMSTRPPGLGRTVSAKPITIDCVASVASRSGMRKWRMASPLTRPTNAPAARQSTLGIWGVKYPRPGRPSGHAARSRRMRA